MEYWALHDITSWLLHTAPLYPLTNCFPILSHGLLVGLWNQFGGLPPVFSEWRIIKHNVCGTHRIVLWNTSFWYMSVCVYVPDHAVRFYFFYRLWPRCLKATAPGVASAVLLPALSELHASAHRKYFSLSGWQNELGSSPLKRHFWCKLLAHLQVISNWSHRPFHRFPL